MNTEEILTVSDATFEKDVLKSTLPVLVDFWAEWCGPCKMIAPLIHQSAIEHAGKLTIAKMDVDKNTEIPAKFGIRGIPTMIIFKNGEAVATKVGAVSKSQLNDFINAHI